MNRIKVLRLEHDMSQRELATQIGCSQKAIDGWEKGVNEPTAGYICALADCFLCSTDYLLGRADDFGVVNVNPERAEKYKDILALYTALSTENQKFIFEFATFLNTRK